MTTRRAMTILGFPLSQTFEETEISGKIWVTRGRCYDHNFQRFFPIFGETIGLFGENILKIITSVPDYRNPGSLQTTSQEENLSKTFKERKTGKVCIIDIYVVYLCMINYYVPNKFCVHCCTARFHTKCYIDSKNSNKKDRKRYLKLELYIHKKV
jgi:hypothetical protein